MELREVWPSEAGDFTPWLAQPSNIALLADASSMAGLVKGGAVDYMSWLLFLDESGHDRRSMPYEVRGGIALHVSRLWSFIQGMHRLELECFGCRLELYSKELKGSTLVDRKRFRFAYQDTWLPTESRQKHCRLFLTKGLERKTPLRHEFTAYGQACLEMARGIFELLHQHGAVLFAGAIPRDAKKPRNMTAEEFLRKDQVFLLERFFYLLESEKQHGLLILDEVDKTEDRRFMVRLERYFTKTANGRYRTTWIVPSPLFVSSDLTYAIQAADLCIYCVNWGYRAPSIGMAAPVRPEITSEFAPWLKRLQFRGQGYREGDVFETFGVFFVPDPYQAAG